MSMVEIARTGKVATPVFTRWAGALKALFVQPQTPSTSLNPAAAAQRFAQALANDSNIALDWICCADEMISLSERRYCLLRALAIDPDSERAMRALRALKAD